LTPQLADIDFFTTSVTRAAMSKSALSFLILALLAMAIDVSLPLNENTASTVLKIAMGLFIALFVVALVVGRKFKFDPVLR
jgi:uncharacterized membrane protein YtjA (UPF0391 family)